MEGIRSVRPDDYPVLRNAVIHGDFPPAGAILPTGTVPFLFTDIAGSTRLWERYPEAMREALRRHDPLIRNSVEANHGVVFRTVGDAFCCAFATPNDALQAAVQAQIDQQAE